MTYEIKLYTQEILSTTNEKEAIKLSIKHQTQLQGLSTNGKKFYYIIDRNKSLNEQAYELKTQMNEFEEISKYL